MITYPFFSCWTTKGTGMTNSVLQRSGPQHKVYYRVKERTQFQVDHEYNHFRERNRYDMDI